MKGFTYERTSEKSIPESSARSINAIETFAQQELFTTSRTPNVQLGSVWGILLNISEKGYFHDSRILASGPKDGLNSKRLTYLLPEELVMIDLPEKRAGNEQWLNQMTCPSKYIEIANHC